MKPFRMPLKVAVPVIGVVLIALAGGYIVAKGTFGSRVGEKYAGSSVAQLWYVGTEPHMATRNTQFTMYEFIAPHRKGFKWMVLRRTVSQEGVRGVGGGKSSIVVELLDDNKPRWKFEEAGDGGRIDGDIKGDYVYEVTKYGCCDARRSFSYYSLIDGRKLQSGIDPLSYQELDKLDESLAK